MFQQALLQGYTNVHFTLADYNIEILRLVTIPNVLLSWMMITSQPHSSPNQLSIPCSSPSSWPEEFDIEITPDLLEQFTSDLMHRDITVDAISGPWGQGFIDLLSSPGPPMQNNQDPGPFNTATLSKSNEPAATGDVTSNYKERIILASETIYAPSTLSSFIQVLDATLQGHYSPPSGYINSGNGSTPPDTASQELQRQEKEGLMATALIAAKKLYFGVGGNVDDFVRIMEQELGYAVVPVKEVGGEGVKRTILQITKALG